MVSVVLWEGWVACLFAFFLHRDARTEDGEWK